MRSLRRGFRVAVGYVLGILFLASIVAAVLFDLSAATDLGPLTGVWLALVVAGHIALGAAMLYGWYWYRKLPREPEPAESG